MLGRSSVSWFVIIGLTVVSFTEFSSTARAELVTYGVEFQDSLGNALAGPVTAGSTVFWEISATVSGSTMNNFGIASLSVNLKDDLGEVMTPGTVGSSFAFPFYSFQSGGTFDVPSQELRLIGAFTTTQSAFAVGADPVNGGTLGPHVLAKGSYVVNDVGLHTLSAFASGDTNRYFTAAGQSNAAASPFDSINYGSDTLQVDAIPEPASLAMMGLASLGAWRLRRRRKNPHPATSQVV